jgi:hypothetical protein
MATKVKSEVQERTVQQSLVIKPPNFQSADVKLIGTAPLLQCAFSEKSRQKIKSTQEQGTQAKKGNKKDPKDFMECFNGAMHRGPKGEYGHPAGAFRNAMISACRMVGFKMTHAKLAVFVDADFFDAAEGTPLVRLNVGDPEYSEMAVRNATGVVDLRPRPMWREWSIDLRVRFDADHFTLQDVVNLLNRAGYGGIGEGRPDSKMSNGMGFGTFRIAGPGE